jgi:hypothetical protein
LEIHYTPKHGSWLNMAETELSVLSRQCLDRRIATQEILEREVTAWNRDRNASTATVSWQFTTADARIKLERLYPVIVMSEENAPLPLDAVAAMPPARTDLSRKAQSPRRGPPSAQKAARAPSRKASRRDIHSSTT